MDWFKVLEIVTGMAGSATTIIGGCFLVSYFSDLNEKIRHLERQSTKHSECYWDWYHKNKK